MSTDMRPPNVLDLKTIIGLLIAATLGVFSWTLQRTVAENDQKVAAVSLRSDAAMDRVHAIELAMRDTVNRKDFDLIKDKLAKIETSLAVLVEADNKARRRGGDKDR